MSQPRVQTFALVFTVFLNALLLFQVEPLIAKAILPWFGGAAAVWTVCLMFFQVVLLLGYLYAHLITRNLPRRSQGWVHAAVFAVSILALPIIPASRLRPTATEGPLGHILLVLAVTVGLPYLLLAATGPLLQNWYAQGGTTRSPYRLYAVSNLGSMLGLLTYPFLLEPWLSIRHQAVAWSILYAVGGLLSVAMAFAGREVAARPRRGAVLAPSWFTRALWLALPACGAALLLAVTNHILQNIAAFPFLWIVPLVLYLLTFILCFEGRGWYRRGLFLRLLALALGTMGYALDRSFAATPLHVLLPLYCAGLFLCCMFCHGELARLKPHPEHLTSFYLLIALGGALGGFFVAVVSPEVFRGLYELPVTLGFCSLLLLIVLYRDYRAGAETRLSLPLWAGLFALVIAFNAGLVITAKSQGAGTRVMARNFYGLLRVYERIDPKLPPTFDAEGHLSLPDLRYRELLNGTISHGLQFLAPGYRRWPTTYYGKNSGIGLALQVSAHKPDLRVGVVGLGAGTIAAYGRAGDQYTFYEINPLVAAVASHEFTFLRDSPARTTVVLGDARLSLERDSSSQFDVLAVDAFSGDSIPVHLLTREAFDLYLQHLKPGGILALHISNRFLNLLPVVQAEANRLHMPGMVITSQDDEARGISVSIWALISNQPDLFRDRDLQKFGIPFESKDNQVLWTDDYSSLFGVLK